MAFNEAGYYANQRGLDRAARKARARRVAVEFFYKDMVLRPGHFMKRWMYVLGEIRKTRGPEEDLPFDPDVPVYEEVEALDFRDSSIGDAQMAELRRFTNLESLGLRGTRITDAGLTDVAALSQLKMLDLSDTSVSDAGIGGLIALKRLFELRLSNTRVSGAVVRDLCRFEALAHVDLQGTRVRLRHIWFLLGKAQVTIDGVLAPALYRRMRLAIIDFQYRRGR